MSKKYSQVRAENPAGPLTGAEIFVITQGGESVGTTIQEIADFTGGGGGNIEIVTVSTAGGTITFGFGDEEEVIFVGSASFSSPKTVAFTNDFDAKKLSFSFNITNVAAVITFPSSVIMNDVRWNSGTKEFTPDNIGIHRGIAFFDGTNWLLDISAPYA